MQSIHILACKKHSLIATFINITHKVAWISEQLYNIL